VVQPPQTPPDKQAAADRHQIFEHIALERLRSGSDTTKAVEFLPLPVRLTAVAAVSITALGVLWSLLARVPVQVNGLATMTPEVQVSSAIARTNGEVVYQVSGFGPDQLTERQRRDNQALSAYWGESWATGIPSFDRLNQLALAALDNHKGQELQLPGATDADELFDDISKTGIAYQQLYFKPNTVIARIDDAEAEQQLDAMRSTTQPQLDINRSIIKDRQQRASGFRGVGTLIGSQRLRQQQELQEREALLQRLTVLWGRGFVSTAQLLQEQSVINGLRQQLLQLDRESLNTGFSDADQRQQAEQTQLTSLQAKNQLQSALVAFLNKVFFFAPPTGMYVVSRSIRNGMNVRAGDELYTYSVEKPVLPAIIPVFVDASTSQQLREGMTVLVTPRGISRAQYGGIGGVVVEVGKLPLPAEGIAGFAGGRTLAGTIQQSLPNAYLVRVKLNQADPKYCQQMLSLRCYKWSTNRLPPFPVRLGTLADVQINVQYRRPIEFVMPALRQAVGLVVENR